MIEYFRGATPEKTNRKEYKSMFNIPIYPGAMTLQKIVQRALLFGLILTATVTATILFFVIVILTM